jgi:hypothetical protein
LIVVSFSKQDWLLPSIGKLIRPTKKLHYWDSCVFLAFLKNEKDKINDCISVLKAAENGQVICHRRLL